MRMSGPRIVVGLALLAAARWWGVAWLGGGLHAAAYAALLVRFGVTLRPGREALVTGLARRLNPRFRPDMVRYTRRVTVAWCVLFAGELAASAAMLAWAPRGWWVRFVTLGHLVPVGMLFLGEYALRRRVFGRDGTSMAAMIRAVRRG